jgi:hypothetical protein
MLVAGTLHYTVWKWAPEALQGHVYTGTAAAKQAFLLFVIGLVFRSREVWLVVAVLAGFELQVVACNVWYLVRPWPTPPGSALCSSGLHFPIGLVGLWAVLYVAHRLHRSGSQ